MKIFSNDYNANLPINKWPIKGGTAKFARLFSKLMIKRGYEWVSLVDAYADQDLCANVIIENKKRKWWVVSLPKKYIHNNFTLIKKYKEPGVSGELLVDEIKNILVIEKPDIVFINGSSCFAWALLKASSLANISVVALHAGIWGLEIDLYSDFFTPAGVKVLKKMESDFAQLPVCNVFLNETSKRYFQKNIYKIPNKKTAIIPLPSESGPINKLIKKKTSKKINVGLVARWDRIKNHKAFLGTAKELLKIDNNYNFFAVTSVPETDAYKEFKEDYKKNIKVLPPMTQGQLKSFYRKMDFMLLPSIFDVSPHVVLESALEGVPTFISKNVGYAKIFSDNGLKDFIVDFSNYKLVARKINSMKQKKYPTSFIKMLKYLHDPKKVIDKYEELFNKIIN